MKNKGKFIVFLALITVAALAAAYFLLPMLIKMQEEKNFFKEYYDAKVIEFGEENKNISNVDIAFVGDSITDGYEAHGSAYSEYSVAWRGIGGDTTFGLYDRLEVSLYAVNPKVVVLLIGINNIDTMFENYESVIADICEKLPSTSLIVQSLHPTSGGFSDRNERILAANRRIEQLSSKYGFTYVDVHSALVDENTGEYSSAYTDDGLHPNEKGYEKITETLLPVIEQALK